MTTPLLRHADLLDTGYTRNEIDRMRRSGRLTPVRRGVYREDGSSLPARDRHVLAAHAALPDLARAVSTERALVVADAILHRAVVAERERRTDPAAATVEEITDVLKRFAGRRGSPSARRLVAFADGQAESPGESRSRLLVARAGLPAPVLQWTPPGTSFRCDFAWPDVGVVGEFDGRIKYGRSMAPDEDPSEAVWREKLREDRIRELGYLVVRWIWDELTVPGLVGERIGTPLGRRRA